MQPGERVLCEVTAYVPPPLPPARLGLQLGLRRRAARAAGDAVVVWAEVVDVRPGAYYPVCVRLDDGRAAVLRADEVLGRASRRFRGRRGDGDGR